MNIFQPIRDVSGVEGAFVFDAGSGLVLASDLQGLFHHEVLAAAAKRIVTMFAVADSSFDVCDEWVLQFDRFHLTIRRLGSLTICVFSRTRPRLGFLRVAMSVVLEALHVQHHPPRATGTLPQGVPQLDSMTPPQFRRTPVPAAPPPSVRPPPISSSSSAARPPPSGARPTPRLAPGKPAQPGAPPKKKNPIWG
jgi:hypothetical protein